MKKYDEEELLNRARVAYARAGGTQLAGQESQVCAVGGGVFAVLRNVNGILAVYEWNSEGDSLARTSEWPSEIQAD